MNKEILTLYSNDDLYMVSIESRGDETLSVTTYKWTHEIVPGYGEVCDPFWEPISGPSITDNIETSKKLAEEEFQRLTGQKGFKEIWKEPKD
jgi:hypothetical protein